METEIEEVDFSEKNTIFLELLSSICKASARLLRSDALFKHYSSLKVQEDLTNELLQQRQILSEALVASVKIFYENMKDDGKYGWGDFSLDIVHLEKIINGDTSSQAIIELLEYRKKYTEKIILINCLEVLNAPPVLF